MPESESFQQARAALSTFAQQFAPVFTLLEVVDDLHGAESAVAEARAQLEAKRKELDAIEQRLAEVQAGYEATAAQLEADHAAKVAELEQSLANHQTRVQSKIDALYAEAAQAKSKTEADLGMYAAQIARRVDEQRALDVKIAQRQQILADLTAKLAGAGIG